uniref:Putative secreted protein n=1 Tax=Anopheles marajoara TaxID=58244 RepID=A0A2M4CA89_9DIPT
MPTKYTCIPPFLSLSSSLLISLSPPVFSFSSDMILQVVRLINHIRISSVSRSSRVVYVIKTHIKTGLFYSNLAGREGRRKEGNTIRF